MRVLPLLFLAFAAAAQEPRIRAVLVPAGPPMEEVRADLFFQSGHRGRVTALAFSPSGPLLASAGDDGTVRLYAPRIVLQGFAIWPPRYGRGVRPDTPVGRAGTMKTA